ncbi:FMN-dependent alpha-hydroxy acid dehydrogenase family protein [Phanerochaete sordida]|uniref:L-lactate dehydrogenase (cytochrome) n=1 Tax=Phanerochaete sordida TaxID=48140 RepID=A0A9P3FZ71_9APHY|nr:FMN-dependent alpha-hydroxy acid dehydrogenase family protein [Phanerochaete sordida]
MILARTTARLAGRTLGAGIRGSARAPVRVVSTKAAPKPVPRTLAAAFAAGGALVAGYLAYASARPVALDDASAADAAKEGVPHARAGAPRLIPYDEVQRHNTRESCWVVVDGQVYDATSVLAWHPAGAEVILQLAGKDATKAFVPIHPPNVLSHLPPEAHLGPVDPETLPADAFAATEEELRIAHARAELPEPGAALNLQDIEEFAQKVLTQTAWAYYRSTGDDEYSYWENFAAFKRFWFRPRVLNKISKISTETTMFGLKSSLPIFIAPAALARLGHPDGEMNLVRAAGSEGILQGISNNASCSVDEIMSVKRPGQDLIFQLYMNKDRSASEKVIRGLEREGFKAIMLTVDAAVPGNREIDRRAKGFTVGPAHGKSGTEGGGVALAISGYQDPDVCWDDIPWIQSLTKLPLIIKGIQCVEDAEKAFQYGAQSIILSNHGGRELDFSPSPMMLLYEIRQRRPELLKRHEVYIDGGVRRGTDVLKALCLGARGVGLGRPFLWGNSVWGEDGCRRVIEIMRDEIATGMRLLGVTSIDQLTPELVQYVDRDPVRCR